MLNNHVNFSNDREPLPPGSRFASEHSLDGLLILVIEDHAWTRVAMECLLKPWGCRITLADGALMACDNVRHDGTPDIILSDYQLHDGYDGLNAIRLVREIAGTQIPACLITGAEERELRQQAEAASVCILQKPVPSTLLRSVVWSLLSPMAAFTHSNRKAELSDCVFWSQPPSLETDRQS